MKFIENLQNKTLEEKRRISLILSFVITVLIGALWWISIDVKEETLTATTASPFEEIKEAFSVLSTE